MRVVIVVDMEGGSHIGDVHELFPIFPEYWDHGRGKLTSDVASPARGLLEGGATEVVVMNHHGAGEVEWPNIVVDDLPEGVRLVEWDHLAMREHVDAMFHVGAHARGGSPTFAAHTILPGLRLRVGGELLSESHWWAWSGDVPVVGIVGAEGLADGLGSLSDVPFLAVQRSHDRRTAEPVFADPRETAEAIRSFAAAAMRRGARQRSHSPRGVVLEASIQNGDDAAEAMEGAGWSRRSRTEFTVEAAAWREDGEPVEHAILAAVEAAWRPYAFSLDGVDPTSRASGLAFPAARRRDSEAWIVAWINDRTVEWITPEVATRWEGLEVGQPLQASELARVE